MWFKLCFLLFIYFFEVFVFGLYYKVELVRGVLMGNNGFLRVKILCLLIFKDVKIGVYVDLNNVLKDLFLMVLLRFVLIRFVNVLLFEFIK